MLPIKFCRTIFLTGRAQSMAAGTPSPIDHLPKLPPLVVRGIFVPRDLRAASFWQRVFTYFL